MPQNKCMYIHLPIKRYARVTNGKFAILENALDLLQKEMSF